MGLLCSKNQKQTANVSPVEDEQQRNNGDLENRGTGSAARDETPQDVEMSPLEEEEPPVIDDQFEGRHHSLVSAPAINNSDENAANGTRVAFVGALESGKSTICQQIKVYCKEPPQKIELQHRPAYINDFLFISMDRLINLMRAYNVEFSDPETESYVETIQKNLPERRGRPLLDDEVEALSALWDDPSVQEAYKHRSEINMNDSVEYFFNSISRISNPNYVPTVEDLIRLYIPTVGIVHYVYEINGINYSFYDVSGRMLERKRWLGFYDGFDAIVFILAISEFDQFYENETGRHNRLLHALDLLSETAKDDVFNKSTSLFILLNEVDIFKEKLSRLSLKDYYPDYNGDSDKEALAFMKQLALNQCHESQQEKITVYFITAINTKKMHKCFGELFKTIKESKNR